ncbi:acylneuraminate cytidylyltransferase family protein [Winogradskyella tangerina]|uniref:acylneuraminate cytidylyltransferase family protein n=1 Tax=Winogradskyella tangerina TaxID=2023240 RepID=UPI0029372B14|nr:acylneuraminate cytidylyltransferase family protein [Winogradskyella tangerina]
MGKTIAIIPARGGSKRIPDKNIISFNGLPLLAHSINYAKANPEVIDEVYVSTDSEEIKTIALSHQAKVIERPSKFSNDTAPTISVLKHALELVEDIDSIVLLQPTNPLRPATLLKDAFEVFKNNNYDSLFTVSRDHKKLGKIANNKFIPFNYEIGQRSQDMEPLYFENGLLYITKSELISQGIIFNHDSFPYVVDHPFTKVDIDTYDDLEYAEFLISKGQDQ